MDHSRRTFAQIMATEIEWGVVCRHMRVSFGLSGPKNYSTRSRQQGRALNNKEHVFPSSRMDADGGIGSLPF